MARQYDVASLNGVLTKDSDIEFTFIEALLDPLTVQLADGHDAVCLFVNDVCNAEVLGRLEVLGVVSDQPPIDPLINMFCEKGLTLTHVIQKYVALRCAGYNNVDLEAASLHNIKIARVPAYSPEAVAEFTVGMIMTVVRKYHKAFNRVREGNFLLDGLLGFNLHAKTVGIIGTGKIGLLTGRILSRGFGCTVIASDPYPSPLAAEYGIEYVQALDELLERSDVISLHCPLTDSTKYIINDDTLAKTKKGVILINTSRGGLIDTYALIRRVSSLFHMLVG